MSDVDARAWSQRVESTDAGARLDLYLAHKLSISRSEVRRLLASGAVRIDGHVAGPGDKGRRLQAGQQVQLDGFTPAGKLEVVPEPDQPLQVLVESHGFIVVDKPAGMPVHPLREGETGTVLNAAVARYPQIAGVGEAGLRSGVVHRLDVETSGALAIALEQQAWQRLRDAFRQHRTLKLYRAIVHGKLERPRNVAIDLVIAQHHPARVRVVKRADARTVPDSRRCDTFVEPIEHLHDATLLELRLGTGFLHQARVTLAHLGHPLVGDEIYGGAKIAGAQRPMLHASRLVVLGVEAVAPEPGDMVRCVKALRHGGE